MITNELKQKILSRLTESRSLFAGSDSKFAVSIGIDKAQYNRIKKGDTEKVLSEANWIRLARRLGVGLTDAPEWKTADTPVFRYVTKQLELCQSQGLSAILCDLSDIGKTYVAMHYKKTHRNVVYVDCSQVKSRPKLIRYIAREFGVGSTGLYSDVYGDLVFYLKTLPDPLIILDEAGDLQYEAFLEIKALWNATELSCGFYMMGADGLKEKIRRSIDMKKVGYTEIFSRFGRRFAQVTPVPRDEREQMLQLSAAMIIKANAPEGTDVNRVLRATLGEDGIPSLRRIFKELSKTALKNETGVLG
jgi:hypothetical protein